MALKKYKPVTASQRFKIINDYKLVSKVEPEKSLLCSIGKSGGRNNTGKMTMRYIGGGHKKQYRIIDFKRNKQNIPAKINSIEYDPNRTSYIALLHYADGEKKYIIAPNGMKVGGEIISGNSVAPNVGNNLPLSQIPLGSNIHNIELQPGQGGKLVRSAGTYAQLMSRDNKYVTIKLPSNETRLILKECCATIGYVSNIEHNLEISGKAGRSRWMGVRPRTRGVVMNPVDHPMGGGEGRSTGGHPRSRKGLISKGLKTRSKKNRSNKFIISKVKK